MTKRTELKVVKRNKLRNDKQLLDDFAHMCIVNFQSK